MRRRLLAALALALAAAGAASTVALADEPVIGNVLVPIEHVEPGATFPITGYDLDPGAVITLDLSSGGQSAALGSATVAADGSFASTATLPATFNRGYAELAATSSEGGRWVATVLVGAPSTVPHAAPGASAEDRLLWVGLLLVGLALFVVAGLRYLRR